MTLFTKVFLISMVLIIRFFLLNWPLFSFLLAPGSAVKYDLEACYYLLPSVVSIEVSMLMLLMKADARFLSYSICLMYILLRVVKN